MAVPIPVVIRTVQRGGTGASAMNQRNSQSEPIRMAKKDSAKIRVPSRGETRESPSPSVSSRFPVRVTRGGTVRLISERPLSELPMSDEFVKRVEIALLAGTGDLLFTHQLKASVMTGSSGLSPFSFSG
jgi:hypothetical protein